MTSSGSVHDIINKDMLLLNKDYIFLTLLPVYLNCFMVATRDFLFNLNLFNKLDLCSSVNEVAKYVVS